MKTAGIVLAAGFSRRMGQVNKLLVKVEGSPMARRVASAALAAGLEPVVVVVGHHAADLRQALEGLRAGISALDEDAEAAVVLLGDMPWVQAADVSALVAAFDPAAGREICVAVHEGRRGNPVLWASRFFHELVALEGDVGARALIERHSDVVHEVPAGAGVLRDVDTPAALSSP
jgi:molybdenum cofactor cytidylyltransferase